MIGEVFYLHVFKFTELSGPPYKTDISFILSAKPDS